MFRCADFVQKSDRFKRPRNEDLCFQISATQSPVSEQDILIYAVLDGVSRNHGGRASKAAARFLRKSLTDLADSAPDLWEMDEKSREYLIPGQLQRILQEADRRLRREEPGCCTTATVAVVFDEHVYVCNVGDSPAYLIKYAPSDQKPEMIPLFACQNVAGFRVESGELTEHEAMESDERNILMYHLGGAPDGEVLTANHIHTCSAWLAQNNMLLLGTDGALSVFDRQTMLQWAVECRFQGVRSFLDVLYDHVKNNSRSEDNFTLISANIQVV